MPRQLKPAPEPFETGSMAREPLCFGCGQPTGPFPRLNRLPNGRVCTSCRDRLLETLPPVLPSVSEEDQPEDWIGGREGEAEDGPPGDYLGGA